MILTTSSPCHLASTASNPCSDTGSLSHLGPSCPSSCKLIVLRNHPQPWCSLMLSSINGISTSTNHFLAKKIIFFLGGKGQAGETLQCLQPHPGSWGSASGSPFWGSSSIQRGAERGCCSSTGRGPAAQRGPSPSPEHSNPP